MSTKDNRQAPERQPVQKILLLIGLTLFVSLLLHLYVAADLTHLLLLILGFAIGYTLLHARFGFSSVYRQIVEDGNTEMLRTHLVMLGLAAVLFAPILMFGLALGETVPEGAVAPLSIGLVFGSFLFGFGMEIGSGLAPAALYRMEGARTALILTLAGFLTGAGFGGYHFGFWNERLPAIRPYSIAEDTPLGYPGALILLLGFFAIVAFVSYSYKKRKRPPALPPMPTAVKWRKILYGTWPLFTGAAVLALLNALVFYVQGAPWKLTASFTLWAGKMIETLGIDVSGWEYWSAQGEIPALVNPLFTDTRTILNIGVMLGAFVTLSLSGLVRFQKAPLHLCIKALAGGILMGYGATISFGANVGAYFSGIASFSAHAWIWTLMAIAGVYTAYYLETQFDLTRSQK
ncbi:YeeE/YedE family protein [Salisediminibacterium halotolerans]|uniref:YeeE/YedE family protein n=1 Tax=Salisediminibacterium halotolerans TaxID=517425 RepID=UPI000EADCDF8|nr:YeeE/YedE family protein [Salisediminibacterium halotolerans]RLJ81079.1 hypothetical protein BCL39_0016 [Actinophytocola xinjiangensis]RPE84112.1 hypothetical protein EDD67_2675 [Salisediminibacterium halotolerans]TWG38506.1 hypothetical protein BCL52_0016 [Salisediminibacterium halotolerans]GEL08662.1 hypothetical protein SHA02_20780 [Salisediminibacterium halotolerans]